LRIATCCVAQPRKGRKLGRADLQEATPVCARLPLRRQPPYRVLRLHEQPEHGVDVAAGAQPADASRRPRSTSPLPDPRSRREVSARLRRAPLGSETIRVIRTPVRAPNANAHMERWASTVRRKCLDRLLILGRRQLEHVLHVYIKHYNQQRPHRALDLIPPDPRAPSCVPTAPDSLCAWTAATCSAASFTNTKSPMQRDDRVSAPHAPSSQRRTYSVASTSGLCTDAGPPRVGEGEVRARLDVRARRRVRAVPDL
jgi:Integrase core domain